MLSAFVVPHDGQVRVDMVKTCAQGTMPTCPLLETLAQAGQ